MQLRGWRSCSSLLRRRQGARLPEVVLLDIVTRLIAPCPTRCNQREICFRVISRSLTGKCFCGFDIGSATAGTGCQQAGLSVSTKLIFPFDVDYYDGNDCGDDSNAECDCNNEAGGSEFIVSSHANICAVLFVEADKPWSAFGNFGCGWDAGKRLPFRDRALCGC